MRRSHTIFPIVLVLAGLSGCSRMEDPWHGKGGPPRVVASFPPVAVFVREVGDDRVGLITLCTTTGPHDYQFNVRNTVLVQKADLLVGVGLGLDDHFVDRLKSNSGNGKLRFRKLGEAIAQGDLIADPNYVPGKHEHNEDGSCCGGHGPNDPHVWLGSRQAIAMVNQVRDDLTEIDPAGAAEYQANAARFVEQLVKLHAEGRAKLKEMKAPLITFHASMNYFSRDLGLKVLGAVQLTPGSEPDQKAMTKLLQDCKGQERVVIAVEPQYPPRAATTLAETLRKQHGKKVAVVELDPLETCDADASLSGEWYLNKVRQNFAALARASFQ